jgi:hypothetical protein
MTDEQLIAILGSMQADLKAELRADLKAEMSYVKTETSSMKAEMASKTEMVSMKEELIEHIHAVGAQLYSEIQEAIERTGRINAKFDRNLAEFEGIIEQFEQWEKRQLNRSEA